MYNTEVPSFRFETEHLVSPLRTFHAFLSLIDRYSGGVIKQMQAVHVRLGFSENLMLYVWLCMAVYDCFKERKGLTVCLCLSSFLLGFIRCFSCLSFYCRQTEKVMPSANR
eukprot:TRINITY_DN7446_c0_g1_i1.p3 TRINITY_DN7446_c0_g1~~TRINITY_DN7446_c0_g1_i1.p3  ORF type:complete len:111 (+),score=8.71 TRINITY_DN7446_c0_g1_i1:485-817(+)